ncbi:MAG: hypothetical protein ACLFVG_09360 [Candidatus Aminicenantes bacterium]
MKKRIEKKPLRHEILAMGILMVKNSVDRIKYSARENQVIIS